MFEQFRWDFRSPEERGDAGENIIYKALNKVHGRKALLPNCYIPVGQKGTTEIDMVFLHESGLYVIESKITVAGFSAMKSKNIGRNV